MIKSILTYILIGIVSLIGFGVFIRCNNKPKKETTEKPAQTANISEQNPYMNMRKMALGVTAEKLGFQIPNDSIKVYGIISDSNNVMTEIRLKSEQNQKYQNIDIKKFNEKLTLQKRELTAREIMELYYPYTTDDNAEGNETISISEPSTNNGYTFITLIHNNQLDDSVKAEKYEMSLIQKGNKWKVISLKKNWACWEGRGHQNWGIKLCN